MNHSHLSVFLAHELTQAFDFNQFIGMESGIKIYFCASTHEPIFSNASEVKSLGVYGMPLVDECEIFIDTKVSLNITNVINGNSTPNAALLDKLIIKELFTQIYRQIHSIKWLPDQIETFNKKISAFSNEIAFIEKELLSEVINNVYH